MSPRDGERVPIVTCTVRGKRLTATSKDKRKWGYVAHSEAEAELMLDAVLDRNYIYPKYWNET
jgi:hypothetical protein